jgi:hypothetical protein
MPESRVHETINRGKYAAPDAVVAGAAAWRDSVSCSGSRPGPATAASRRQRPSPRPQARLLHPAERRRPVGHHAAVDADHARLGDCLAFYEYALALAPRQDD